MLISHNKKFIFIHVFKVAGTSIRGALSPYCYPKKIIKIRDKILNHRPIQSNDFTHHVTANGVKLNIPPSMYNDYFKFGIVRNPWDWQVSIYHFTQQNKEHFQHDLVKNMSFEEYIVWRVEEAYCSQKEFLYDKDDKLIVDYIGRIENLNKDFEIICNRIGVKNNLEHKNKSIHKDYRKMYNDFTYQLIANAYKDEIKLFDYNFDGIKN